MKRISFFIICILLIAVSFWIGTKSGRYFSSIERENEYPFNFRDVWVNNQPTCDDYYLLLKKEKPIQINTVMDDNNQLFVKIVSLPLKTEGKKVIYSIFNRDQEQYIDELWMDCK